MKKGGRPLRLILWIFILLIIILFIVASFVPAWLSTPSGTQTAVRWINAYIPGHLAVEKMHLSWFGKQKIEHLHLKDAQDTDILKFENFETDTSLLYLLLGGRKFNRTLLASPYLLYDKNEKGETSLEKAISRRPKKEESKPTRKKSKTQLPTFKDGLTISHGSVVLSTPATKVTIADIQIEKQPASDTYLIQAKTRQAEVEGSIFVKASFTETSQIEGNIISFPIAILDQIVGTDLFTEAFGKTVNANLAFEKTPQGITANGKIESPNLQATISGEVKEGKLFFNPQTQFSFTVTPNFFKQWVAPSQQNEWILASKAELKVQIEKAILPLNLKQLTLHNVILNASASMERAELSHATGGSYSLNHLTLMTIILDNLEIEYKGVIQGKESADLSGTISLTPDGKILFKYDYKGFPVSLLEIFYPEVSQNLRLLFGPTFEILGNGTYYDKALDASFSLTAGNIQMKGQAEGTLPSLAFAAKGNMIIPAERAKILGPSLAFEMQGRADIQPHSMTIPLFSGKVSNAYYALNLHGNIGEANRPFSFDQINIEANGKIFQLPFVNVQHPISFKEGVLFARMDGSKNLIQGKADLVATVSPSESRLVDARFELHDFIQNGAFSFSKTDLLFFLNAEGLPLTALSPFLPEQLDLTPFFGSIINVDASGSYSPQKNPRGFLDLKANGSGVQLLLSVLFSDQLLVMPNKPSSLYWEITPARYDALIKILRPEPEYSPNFELVRTTPLHLTINELTLPKTLPDTLTQLSCQSGLSGDLQIGTTSFRSKSTNETVILHNLGGVVQGTDFSKSIELKLHGNLFAENVPKTEQAGFHFEGNLLNFCTPAGHFNRKGLSLKGELSLDLIPVRQIMGIIPIEERTRQMTQAILGELVNARIYGEISQLSGPLTIDIKASNFKALVPLQLEPHAIYLRNFVDAEITLTPDVSETFLKDINPLLITGAFSDHPLKVYIDPQDFILPIHPFSFRDMRIGKAIFDLGKIHVHNGGQIQSLMEFLKAKEISPDGSMDAWFTPIFMNLQNGVASYKRFDALLAGNVHIALWGQIDLIKDKVRMTLGIAPTTLQQRFGILGLNKKDMFQVKMRGSTEKLDLDWSSAYTRIGIIIARTAGGHIGYIVGGIVEQLVTAFGEEPVPPPTTDPFPWESQYSSEPGQGIPQEAIPKKNGKKGVQKLIEFLIP